MQERQARPGLVTRLLMGDFVDDCERLRDSIVVQAESQRVGSCCRVCRHGGCWLFPGERLRGHRNDRSARRTRRARCRLRFWLRVPDGSRGSSYDCAGGGQPIRIEFIARRRLRSREGSPRVIWLDAHRTEIGLALGFVHGFTATGNLSTANIPVCTRHNNRASRNSPCVCRARRFMIESAFGAQEEVS